MWILAVVGLAAACVVLLIQVLQIRSRLNMLADVAAAWCEAEHG